MGKITRRVAVVTGGSSGIGLAIVTALLDAGYNVAFFGQNPDHVEEARIRLNLRAEESRLIARTVDLTMSSQVRRFFDEVSEHWVPPDTLVCNAGISPKGADGATPFVDIGLDEWQQVMAVNLTGALLCCQAVLPPMMRQGFGRIILIGSIAGRTVPRIAGVAYSASKAGLAGLSRSLVATTAGSGVTTNMIAPGRIMTGLAGGRESAVNQAALSRIPVGRLGEASDIAGLVRFLASQESGFINGAVIDANGGEFAPL